MLRMPTSARRVAHYWWLSVCLGFWAACSSSSSIFEVADGETFAELRVIKGEARISDGSSSRPPYPRDRLRKAQSVVLEADSLAWMRRDAGATWLVAGPGELQLQPDAVVAKRGRYFIDTEQGEAVFLDTPRGRLTLGSTRASIDVFENGDVHGYVLRGDVSFGAETRARAGEQFKWVADGVPQVTPAVAWTDWTGGLAVADSVAAPAPFGIGTVGARKANETGKPRFPLLIQRLEVQVTIDGDFAVTEVDETFVNPTTDTVEGLFSFRTPEGAILQRFGVDRDDGLVWGRIKESAVAEEQYQANVYEGSSEEPALLKWQGAGTYSARFYPITSRARRRVVTRYSEWLPRHGEHGERRLYVYPMAAEGAHGSLPRIEELSVTIDLTRARATSVRSGMGAKRQGDRVVVRASDVMPRADLAVELFDEGADATSVYRAPHNLLTQEPPQGSDPDYASQISKEEVDYVAVPIRIPQRVNKQAEPAENTTRDTSVAGIDLAIIVDTSAATEPSALALARNLAGTLLSHLGANDRAAVWTGDAVLHPVAPNAGVLTPVSAKTRETWLAGLAAVDRGGATDLGALLQDAASKLDPQRRGSVVYIGDGAPSVGELVPQHLSDRLARLPTGARIFAAALGTEPNLPMLEAVTRGGQVFAVQDGQSAALSALRILEETQRFTWLDNKLDLGPGVERVFPRVLPPLAEGDTVVVVGRLVGVVPKQITLTGSGGSTQSHVVSHTLDDHGDLRRRWGEARFTELHQGGSGRAELVDVAQRSGIVTHVTSFYVPTRREEKTEAASEVAVELAYEEQRARERRWQPWRNDNGWFGLSPRFATAEAPSPTPLQPAALGEDAKEGGTGVSPRHAVRSREEPSAPDTAAPSEAQLTKDAYHDEERKALPALKPARAASVRAETRSSSPWKRESSSNDDPLNQDLDDSPRPSTMEPLSALGLIGHGAGGDGQGFGAGMGRLGGSHKTKSSALKMETVTVNGGLPKEIVQRILRQNFGTFRLCGERSTTGTPDGRVGVRFQISARGEVSNAQTTAATTVSDAGMVHCITESLSDLTFPPPERPPTQVSYVLSFGDGSGTGEVGTPYVATPNRLGSVGHTRTPCGAGADLPAAERLGLWRERLRNGRSVNTAVHVYTQALHACEAPTVRERNTLLVMLVDNLVSTSDRVQLWRRFLELSPRAADVIYRSLLLRVQSPTDVEELHRVLGFRQVEPEILAKLLTKAKDVSQRAALLRGVAQQFPDDLELALQVLEGYEDARDEASGRAWARQLRRRADATTHVRTYVGEYYLRLSQYQKTPQLQAVDLNEARRTFGEIVEFAPNDPLARRQLGDLLGSHGWYEEAQRQYATLLSLTPDDPTIALLLASTAAGLGKTQEAITWLEKATATTSSEAGNPLFAASQALASQYLAAARIELTNPTRDPAVKGDSQSEHERLRLRARRWITGSQAGLRVLLTWSHPELRPSLWLNQAGTMLLAQESQPLLGVSQGYTSLGSPRFEIRFDPVDAARAARLGLRATLTVLIDEGQANEQLATTEVLFTRSRDVAREVFAFRWENGIVAEGER